MTAGGFGLSMSDIGLFGGVRKCCAAGAQRVWRPFRAVRRKERGRGGAEGSAPIVAGAKGRSV